MQRFRYTVLDERGLHARNAMSLCKLAETFASGVTMQAGGRRADCKNVMALMNLRVYEKDVVEFLVEGDDEEEALSILKATVPTML